MEARTIDGRPIAVRDDDLLDAIWSICGADPTRRRVFITPVAGDHGGRAAGVMLAVEGSPPKGMLYLDCSARALFAFDRSRWRRVDQAKKYAAAVRVIFRKAGEHYPELRGLLPAT